MDLSKVFIIGVDFKDRRGGPEWEHRLFAEVVVIDKTDSNTKPLLYQLKDTVLPLEKQLPFLKQGFHPAAHDAFVVLGDVELIDKKSKQIVLNNKNVVSYNYLIIASGSRSNFYNSAHEAEFIAGLQALVDALRFRKKVESSLNPSSKNEDKLEASRLSRFFCNDSSGADSAQIKNVVHPWLAAEENGSIHLDLAAVNRRLYEVQV